MDATRDDEITVSARGWADVLADRFGPVRRDIEEPNFTGQTMRFRFSDAQNLIRVTGEPDSCTLTVTRDEPRLTAWSLMLRWARMPETNVRYLRAILHGDDLDEIDIARLIEVDQRMNNRLYKALRNGLWFLEVTPLAAIYLGNQNAMRQMVAVLEQELKKRYNPVRARNLGAQKLPT